MTPDEPGDPLPLLVRQSPPLANRVRSGRIDVSAQGDGERKRETGLRRQPRQLFDHLLRRPRSGLVVRHDFRQNLRRQPAFQQQLHAGGAARIGQHPPHLGRDPLGADDVNLGGHFARIAARESASMREIQRGREPHRPQHPQLVLGKAVGGMSDGPDMPGRQVHLPADEVDHPLAAGIVEQPVDGEVAARGVFLGRAEGDAGRDGGRRCTRRRGETWSPRPCRPPCGPTTEITPNAAPMATVRRRPNTSRISCGRGVGGHVVVLRRPAEQAGRGRSRRPNRPRTRPPAIGGRPRRRNGVVHRAPAYTKPRPLVAPQSRDRWSRHKAAIADRATKPRPLVAPQSRDRRSRRKAATVGRADGWRDQRSRLYAGNDGLTNGYGRAPSPSPTLWFSMYSCVDPHTSTSNRNDRHLPLHQTGPL